MVSKFLIALSAALALTISLPLQASMQEMIVGMGDELMIDVYNEKDLFVKARVGRNGEIRVPLLGNIKVTGKTPNELSEELEQAYLDGYLVNPSVTVTITDFRPFFIRGAVRKAGSYGYQMELTVDQAIAIAGGLKDRASRREWFILRETQTQSIKVTKETKVLPGDIIEIKESLF